MDAVFLTICLFSFITALVIFATDEELNLSCLSVFVISLCFLIVCFLVAPLEETSRHFIISSKEEGLYISEINCNIPPNSSIEIEEIKKHYSYNILRDSVSYNVINMNEK